MNNYYLIISTTNKNNSEYSKEYSILILAPILPANNSITHQQQKQYN